MSENQGPLRIEALEALYRGRYAQFLRVVFAIVGDRETAHEVVQEAFAKAIRSRFDFRGDGAPEAWVWAIVVNLARSTARRELPTATEIVADAAADSNGHADAWPELRAAVAALPERQRLAIFLRHYADQSQEQIAAVLQIERGTVAATLHAAHAALRKQMSEVLQ